MFPGACGNEWEERVLMISVVLLKQVCYPHLSLRNRGPDLVRLQIHLSLLIQFIGYKFFVDILIIFTCKENIH